MGFGHLDKKFISRMKRFNELFSWHYPETTHKLCVVNAPRVFSMFWAIGKHFVHPVTAAKVHIVSGSCERLFNELGLQLDAGVEMRRGKVPDSMPTWHETLERLKAENPIELL